MTNHKAEAMGLLYTRPRHIEAQAVQYAEAQVHATMYLAEQQRAANLIALVACGVTYSELGYEGSTKLLEEVIGTVKA